MNFDIDVAIQDYRDRFPRLGEDRGWWVLYPAWMYEHREEIKANWHKLCGLPLGDLQGFEFAAHWADKGPRFTIDPATGEWDR